MPFPSGALFASEDRVLQLASPLYVLGDIHGNMTDLRFFSENLWTLGMPLTAGTFLFLGDYVDRGKESLEVVAYLFALKVSCILLPLVCCQSIFMLSCHLQLMCPRKMFMIRGNHELRRVNGWESWYKDGCFLTQCKKQFGVDLGTEVWEEVNLAFDALPLCAIVDGKVSH